MRSFSVRPSRLILVPSAPPVTRPCAFPSHVIPVSPQSHALLPFRPTSSPSVLQSHTLLPFRPTSSSSAPPVTRPFTFPSHIILVSPSISTSLCLSVPRHPRQSSSHIPFYLSVSRPPRQPLQSHALLPFRPISSSSTPPFPRPFTFPSHIIPVSPPVTYPFTFPSHIILVSPPVTRSCTFPSHIPVSPPVTYPFTFSFHSTFRPTFAFFLPLS